MKKILILIISVSVLVGCEDCFGIRIVDRYLAYLSVKNATSYEISNIKIETWISSENLDAITYTYDDLQSGEQSAYMEVVTGEVLSANVSSSTFIIILRINYTMDGVAQSVTVFDDGLSYSYSTVYESLTDEELEKVYLKKDANNTLVITDTGVELLQGE